MKRFAVKTAVGRDIEIKAEFFEISSSGNLEFYKLVNDQALICHAFVDWQNVLELDE